MTRVERLQGWRGEEKGQGGGGGGGRVAGGFWGEGEGGAEGGGPPPFRGRPPKKPGLQGQNLFCPRFSSHSLPVSIAGTPPEL